jgi:hypothetical protein
MVDTDRVIGSCSVVLANGGKFVRVAVLLILDPKSVVTDKERSSWIGRLMMC